MGSDSIFSRFAELIRSPTPIRHGCIYRDTITGERFKITTVGRWVEIERMDAERRPDNTVRKEEMRDAIKSGIVVFEEKDV